MRRLDENVYFLEEISSVHLTLNIYIRILGQTLEKITAMEIYQHHCIRFNELIATRQIAMIVRCRSNEFLIGEEVVASL